VPASNAQPCTWVDSFFSFLHEHGLPVRLIEFNGSWSSVEHLLRYQTCKTHTAVFCVRSFSVSARSRSFGGIYCLLFWIWSVKMKTARSLKRVVPTHQGVTTQMMATSETRRPQDTARSGQLYPTGVMNMAQYNTDKPQVITSVWLQNCGHGDESKKFQLKSPTTTYDCFTLQISKPQPLFTHIPADESSARRSEQPQSQVPFAQMQLNMCCTII